MNTQITINLPDDITPEDVPTFVANGVRDIFDHAIRVMCKPENAPPDTADARDRAEQDVVDVYDAFAFVVPPGGILTADALLFVRAMPAEERRVKRVEADRKLRAAARKADILRETERSVEEACGQLVSERGVEETRRALLSGERKLRLGTFGRVLLGKGEATLAEIGEVVRAVAERGDEPK